MEFVGVIILIIVVAILWRISGRLKPDDHVDEEAARRRARWGRNVDRLARGAIVGGIIGGTIGGVVLGVDIVTALLGAISGGIVGGIVFVFGCIGSVRGRFCAIAGSIVASGIIGVIGGFLTISIRSSNPEPNYLGAIILGTALLISQSVAGGAVGSLIGTVVSLTLAEADDEN